MNIFILPATKRAAIKSEGYIHCGKRDAEIKAKKLRNKQTSSVENKNHSNSGIH